MLLGMDKHLVIIKTFENKKEGMKYYSDSFSATNVLKELNKTEHKKILISSENFKELFKNQDLTGYHNFFKKNYLDKTN